VRFTRLKDTYLVRLETGEEVVGGIASFAADQRIDAGIVSAIGAAHGIVLGYFDRATREYVKRRFDEDLEIVSLSGTVAIKEGRPYAHLHATVSGRNFETFGGHLFEATTAATCEILVRPLAGYLQRVKDERTGLFVLDL
jgi:predicted DNA-binding protein with PD1-like motif